MLRLKRGSHLSAVWYPNVSQARRSMGNESFGVFDGCHDALPLPLLPIREEDQGP